MLEASVAQHVCGQIDNANLVIFTAQVNAYEKRIWIGQAILLSMFSYEPDRFMTLISPVLALEKARTPHRTWPRTKPLRCNSHEGAL
jgi:hypothetical protein